MPNTADFAAVQVEMPEVDYLARHSDIAEQLSSEHVRGCWEERLPLALQVRPDPRPLTPDP